jgi:hypothetical protein
MSLTSSPVITVEFKISVKNNGYQREISNISLIILNHSLSLTYQSNKGTNNQSITQYLKRGIEFKKEEKRNETVQFISDHEERS